MATQRRSSQAKTRGKGTSKPEPVSLFRDVTDAQMNLWKSWSRKAGTDVNEAAKEIAPIVAEYWAKTFAMLWESAARSRITEDPLAGQEELRRQTLVSYNEMMKKVLATKSFAARSGKGVKGLLDGVKAWNETMEETLKTLHLPSKGDIDELHEALYSLNKRVDYLARSLEEKEFSRTK